ncbi:Pentatricopeptide repeat-containing protein [Platanthera zijinensis]|uniref:Pentatricopeptide repeat-containing protein n=1 Tax=Platanthera zijinensis TaxID=2320716 RepID=A0AAP0G217_9ASPA
MLPSSSSRLRFLIRLPRRLFSDRRQLSSVSPPSTISPSTASLPSPYRPHSSFLPFSSSTATTTTTSESSESDDTSSLSSASTQESIIYVLKKLDKNPKKALNFFNFATAQYGLRPSPSAYNLMLRTLAHKDHLADFWAFLNSMKNNGCQLEDGVFCLILDSFKRQKLFSDCSALRQFYSRAAAKKSSSHDSVDSAVKLLLDAQGWCAEIESRLGDLKLSLSEESVAKIVRDLRNYPQKALDFFAWSSKMPDYRHGSIARNAMARVLGREESIDSFWSLVKGMKPEGHDMDIDTYVKITRQFLKRNMMKDAVELYEFMMDGPYKPAIQDCGMLLRQISLSPIPDIELVFRAVKKYESAGYSLSKVVYDGIHRSLTSTAKFEESMEIMKKMRQEGYEPDNITYSQLVYGLCKAKRFDDACKILDEMEAGGCPPDLKTWTVLIQGYCSAGEVDGALECLTKMIEKNCDADADLVEVLVKGLCGKNRTKSAYTLMVEMINEARVKPWQATFKYLIEELLEAGMLEEASKLLGLMKSYNFPPFGRPFVGYISKCGTVEDAEEYLKILSGKTCPSPATYVNLFKAFFEQGRYAEAQNLLFKCPHHIRKHAEISKLFGSVKGGDET